MAENRDGIDRQEDYNHVSHRTYKALCAVEDRDSFYAFIRILLEDAEAWEKDPGDYGWRNGTDFKDCLWTSLAWAKGHDLLPKEASWHAFAEFLYFGKIIE